MSQLKQKDAVVQAVKTVLGSRFTESAAAKSLLSDDDLETVRKSVLDGILAGSVEFGKETSDQKAVQRYVNGMVDNHLRKAKELNGGTKYVPERRKSAASAGVDASVLPPELQSTLSE